MGKVTPVELSFAKSTEQPRSREEMSGGGVRLTGGSDWYRFRPGDLPVPLPKLTKQSKRAGMVRMARRSRRISKKTGTIAG